MFCSRTLTSSLDYIHEQALCLVLSNYNSSFCDIFEMSNEKTIHRKLFEYLAKETYKFINGSSPPKMNDISRLEKPLTTSEISASLPRHEVKVVSRPDTQYPQYFRYPQYPRYSTPSRYPVPPVPLVPLMRLGISVPPVPPV